MNVAEQVDKAIIELKETYGKSWPSYYFNNFIGLLPGGYKRWRIGPKEPDWQDYYLKKPTSSQYSELRKNQSLIGFLTTIDAVIEDLGIEIQDILKIQEITQGGANMYDEEFITLIKPIWITLIELGYDAAYDLSS